MDLAVGNAVAGPKFVSALATDQGQDLVENAARVDRRRKRPVTLGHALVRYEQRMDRYINLCIENRWRLVGTN